MSAAGGSGASSAPHAATPARAPPCTWRGPIPDTEQIRLSLKAQSFTESVISEMTRLNLALHVPEKAVNFAQGFRDFDTDPSVLDAGAKVLREGFKRYEAALGAPHLRDGVARKVIL